MKNLAKTEPKQMCLQLIEAVHAVTMSLKAVGSVDTMLTSRQIR